MERNKYKKDVGNRIETEQNKTQHNRSEQKRSEQIKTEGNVTNTKKPK